MILRYTFWRICSLQRDAGERHKPKLNQPQFLESRNNHSSSLSNSGVENLMYKCAHSNDVLYTSSKVKNAVHYVTVHRSC